ncbi:MAG: ABC transporter permease [Acidimicrobiia bacterium]|nr:ABC transporter permease [Acidimicrobiia bacterium]
MNVAVIHNILLRLLRLRRLIGLALLTGMPAGVLFFLTFGNSEQDIRGFYEMLNITVLTIIALPVTALVLASAAFGEERNDQTLTFLVTKPLPRWHIALSMLTAATLATFAVGGIGIVAGWVVAAVAVGDATIGLNTTVGLVVASLGYSAVFVPLGLLVSRSTLTGLAFIFIWEFIIGASVTGVSTFSVFRTALSAYGDVGTVTIDAREALEGVLGNVIPGVGGAFAKVGVLLVLSLAFTTWVLRRRDLANE